MPRLESYSQPIVFRVSNLYIAEILHTLELIRAGKLIGEVLSSPTDSSYIKITDAMIGVSRWCQ